jgi:hypothetical protein
VCSDTSLLRDLLSQQHFVLRLIRRVLSMVFFYCALVVHTFGRRYYDRNASSGGTLIIWPTQSLEGYVTSPPFVHSDVIVNGALCCARLHLPRETKKQTIKQSNVQLPLRNPCMCSARSARLFSFNCSLVPARKFAHPAVLMTAHCPMYSWETAVHVFRFSCVFF